MKVKIEKEIDLNIGDAIEVITEDGRMIGTIKDIRTNQVQVYIEEFGESDWYLLKSIII